MTPFRKKTTNRLFIGSAVTIAALLMTAVFAPWLAPYDPNAQNLKEGLKGPDLNHPLGTDKMGRDILSRLIYGARISLYVGFATTLTCLIVGTLLGAFCGYIGGAIDSGLCRVIDILLAFPGILLALALMAILGPSVTNVIIALCAVGWVSYARLARSQMLALKEREFVIAATSMGGGSGHIVTRHLLPNIMAPLFVEASFGVGSAIVGEAGLSFLGLGVQPPTASWGSMLNQGRQFLLIAPHITAFPGLAIMLVVLSVNVFGDGLRDLLDPKSA